MEVLKLVVVGKNNKEIASELGIAHKTAKNHKGRIYKKTGCVNNVQLLTKGLIWGWIESDDLPTQKKGGASD